VCRLQQLPNTPFSSKRLFFPFDRSASVTSPALNVWQLLEQEKYETEDFSVTCDNYS
jgi:hypothetical protein